MEKKVAAIVVTYNRAKMLEECISCLLKSEYPVEILVIDNHSQDETGEVVASYLSSQRVFYFDTGANLGGAGGYHYGIRKAFEKGYDYFWLMDDDTLVWPDSLSILMNNALKLNEDFGYLSSLALWKDGEVCKMNYHEVAITWNEEKKRLLDGMLPIQIATFVSFLVPAQVVKDVGLPLKEYFIWGDDTEYSKRISKKYKSYLCFQSRVTHQMAQNGGTREVWEIEDLNRLSRIELSIRNDLCTYRRHSKTMFVLYFLRLWKDLFKVFRVKCTGKGKRTMTILRGMGKGLFFSPKVEYLKKE